MKTCLFIDENVAKKELEPSKINYHKSFEFRSTLNETYNCAHINGLVSP